MLSYFFPNKFSITCSSSSPSGIPMIQMLACLKMSQSLLILFSSFFNSVFFLLFWLNFLFFMFHIIDLILTSSSLLLVPCKFFFISVSVTFISAWFVFILLKYPVSSLSILIISVLNSGSHRLLISICLVLFLVFCSIWAIFHCLLIFGSLPVFVSVY